MRFDRADQLLIASASLLNSHVLVRWAAEQSHDRMPVLLETWTRAPASRPNALAVCGRLDGAQTAHHEQLPCRSDVCGHSDNAPVHTTDVLAFGTWL